LLGSDQLRLTSSAVLIAVTPILGATLIAGGAAVLLQTKFLLILGGLHPKISRVSPAAGLKRLFGFNGVVEIVKSLGKLALLVTAIWAAVRAVKLS